MAAIFMNMVNSSLSHVDLCSKCPRLSTFVRLDCKAGIRGSFLPSNISEPRSNEDKKSFKPFTMLCSLRRQSEPLVNNYNSYTSNVDQTSNTII